MADSMRLTPVDADTIMGQHFETVKVEKKKHRDGSTLYLLRFGHTALDRFEAQIPVTPDVLKQIQAAQVEG